jgi:hypothetical protein
MSYSLVAVRPNRASSVEYFVTKVSRWPRLTRDLGLPGFPPGIKRFVDHGHRIRYWRREVESMSDGVLKVTKRQHGQEAERLVEAWG